MSTNVKANTNRSLISSNLSILNQKHNIIIKMILQNKIGNKKALLLNHQLICLSIIAENQDEFDQMASGAKQPAVTSSVSLTESKLIIALKKQLIEAKALLEREHAIKLRLIEGARSLKHELVQAIGREERGA